MNLNLGIRGHDFDRTETAEMLAEKLKQADLHSIQLALPISFPRESFEARNMNPGMAKFYKNIFAKEDIDIAILSCYINMIHPDSVEREKLLTKFSSYLRYAREFGASMVATETGNVDAEIHYTSKNFTESAFQKVVESVKFLSSKAEKFGMIIGIEGGINHPICSPEKMRRLLDEVNSPNVQVILDPTNFIDASSYKRQNEFIKQSFSLFGEDIAAIHLKDFIVENGTLKIVSIGKGIMDFRYLLESVKKEKPYLNLIMEETKEKDIELSIEYLTDIAKQID